jgi:hypothetical protein
MQVEGRMKFQRDWNRRMKKIYCPGNFRIEPWDSRFYAVFQGEDLICVTAYKIGAVRVIDLLYSLQISLERLKTTEGGTQPEQGT